MNSAEAVFGTIIELYPKTRCSEEKGDLSVLNFLCCTLPNSIPETICEEKFFLIVSCCLVLIFSKTHISCKHNNPTCTLPPLFLLQRIRDIISDCDLVRSGILSTQLNELSLVSWFYAQLEMKHHATTCSITYYYFPPFLVEWGGELK